MRHTINPYTITCAFRRSDPAIEKFNCIEVTSVRFDPRSPNKMEAVCVVDVPERETCLVYLTLGSDRLYADI